MIEWLLEANASALLSLNGLHCQWLDFLMPHITYKWTWVPMYVIFLIALIRVVGWRQALLALMTISLCVAITDQACSTYLRPMVSRMRPSNPDNPISSMVTLVNGYRAGRWGFPSAHAANSMVLAVILSGIFTNRRFTVFIFVWTATVCYSRVYLGVHYPGDIIAGLCLGALIGWGGLTLYRYIVYRVTLPERSTGHLFDLATGRLFSAFVRRI